MQFWLCFSNFALLLNLIMESLICEAPKYWYLLTAVDKQDSYVTMAWHLINRKALCSRFTDQQKILMTQTLNRNYRKFKVVYSKMIFVLQASQQELKSAYFRVRIFSLKFCRMSFAARIFFVILNCCTGCGGLCCTIKLHYRSFISLVPLFVRA